MNFVIWIRECDHRAFHQDLPRSINLNYVIARMIGSYAGAVPTDKLPFQWNLVSYRLSTMLILNMSMRSALRHSYGGFLENRFSRLKTVFREILFFGQFRIYSILNCLWNNIYFLFHIEFWRKYSHFNSTAY